jgi:hypothetical protein
MARRPNFDSKYHRSAAARFACEQGSSAMRSLLRVTFAFAGCAILVGCEPASPSESTPAAAQSAATESVKAQVGVGKQGRSLDNETGIGKMVSAPVSAFFAVKERVAFDIQIPQALGLYRATEGRFPKSHEEFMEKIIKANQIKLPDLPAGMVYRFNPELGELWVDPQNPPDAGGADAPAGSNP